MKALLISEQTLIANSVLNENISYTQIRPTLVKVQEMRIQPIIGSDLYKEIAAQVVAGSLSQANTTLLEDYLQPAIIQWMYFELPMVLAFKYMNKNMVRRTAEESSAMSMTEIQRVMDKVRNDAEWYSERITKFLDENRADYPLFDNPSNKADTIKPNKGNYTTGMVLTEDRPKKIGGIYGW